MRPSERIGTGGARFDSGGGCGGAGGINIAEWRVTGDSLVGFAGDSGGHRGAFWVLPAQISIVIEPHGLRVGGCARTSTKRMLAECCRDIDLYLKFPRVMQRRVSESS